MRKEKNKKTLVIAFALFIVFSMVISIFAIVLDNPNNDLKYGKYKFSIGDNVYLSKINGQKYEFLYLPMELERIEFPTGAKKALNDSLFFAIFFDPNATSDDLTYVDYARFDLSSKSPKQVYFGVTEYSEKYPLSIMGCENATAQAPLFYINISTNVSITTTDNPYCFTINARLQEIVAVEHRILYQLLGVME